ncbi:MAG: inorganic phosphate transporter family protein [bacterium]|nr:inorganic phosphate transporter family protein [bacterium]
MIKLVAGILLGWALGVNDAAKTVGAAVSSHMISYRAAALLSAVCILLGALIGGEAGMRTLGSLTGQTGNSAFVACLSAAMTVGILTLLHLPVSASQALVGGVLGIGMLCGQMDWGVLGKVLICWLLTPVGGLFIGGIAYLILSRLLFIMNLHFLKYDQLMRWALFLICGYSAYSLGANNVANATGLFLKAGLLTLSQATLIGGLSIALGSLTFSRGVMHTLFSRIILMDSFSALVLLLSVALTLHIFALIGVPVSISQAAIGAVLGIGLMKNFRLLSLSSLFQIVLGWLMSPTLAFIFSIILAKSCCLG